MQVIGNTLQFDHILSVMCNLMGWVNPMFEANILTFTKVKLQGKFTYFVHERVDDFILSFYCNTHFMFLLMPLKHLMLFYHDFTDIR